MSIYLTKVTEQYRCDTEEEAKNLIEEAKQNYLYTVIKSSTELKTVKQKGEIIDEYCRVLITKEFTSEKEPNTKLKPEYIEENKNAYFTSEN